mmetsp:Transcript_7692/g.21410  ORF Transcript_7692/g.21410 Transcript_7692/m.21410 type:complete len:96 (+) Transcript_7692:215-502(+)
MEHVLGFTHKDQKAHIKDMDRLLVDRARSFGSDFVFRHEWSELNIRLIVFIFDSLNRPAGRNHASSVSDIAVAISGWYQSPNSRSGRLCLDQRRD